MAYTIPTDEPENFTKGETVQWYKSFSDFEPADWTLTYTFRGNSAFDATATTSAGVFLVTLSSATTATLEEGNYWYEAKVTDGTSTYVVKTGNFTIKESLANQKAGYDGRSHAKRVLDAIENVIAGRASQSDKSIEIDGRKIDRLTPKELMQFRATYRAEYQAEQAEQLRKDGKAVQNGVFTRFIGN